MELAKGIYIIFCEQSPCSFHMSIICFLIAIWNSPIRQLVDSPACQKIFPGSFHSRNYTDFNLCLNFIYTKGTDALQVIMVLINSETFEQRVWKIFLSDPEIDNSGTYFALKMPMCRSICIVTNFISFDVKCQCHTGLHKQIEYVINSRF